VEHRCRGVVKLIRAFEDDELVYLVFEPAMKGDLYQVLNKQHGPLQESFAATHIIAPLLSTLGLLHSLGIVHRDVKSENCFLSSTDDLQLGDFGLAAHKEFDQLVERVGTLDYMVSWPSMHMMYMYPIDHGSIALRHLKCFPCQHLRTACHQDLPSGGR